MFFMIFLLVIGCVVVMFTKCPFAHRPNKLKKTKHPWGYRLLLASALWMRLYNRFLKRLCVTTLYHVCHPVK